MPIVATWCTLLAGLVVILWLVQEWLPEKPENTEEPYVADHPFTGPVLGRCLHVYEHGDVGEQCSLFVEQHLDATGFDEDEPDWFDEKWRD